MDQDDRTAVVEVPADHDPEEWVGYRIDRAVGPDGNYTFYAYRVAEPRGTVRADIISTRPDAVERIIMRAREQGDAR